MQTYETVEKAIEQQEYWRAKEILQGKLPEAGYDTELFQRYGELLLMMHDKLEAGKYLFLSAERKPEYADAIELYLSRYKKGGIFYTFPKSIQKVPIAQYPSSIQRDMKMLGQTVTQKISNSTDNDIIIKNAKLPAGLCLLILGITLIGTFAGFINGLQIVYQFLFG